MNKVDKNRPVSSIKHNDKRAAIPDSAHQGEEQMALSRPKGTILSQYSSTMQGKTVVRPCGRALLKRVPIFTFGLTTI